MRKCEVYIHGIAAGELIETDSPREYIFRYYGSYASNKENEPVCLSMPLRQEEYRSRHLFPFFFNMLSEGENRMIQALHLHLSPDDDFGFLLATATSDTIGAVTVKSR